MSIYLDVIKYIAQISATDDFFALTHAVLSQCKLRPTTFRTQCADAMVSESHTCRETTDGYVIEKSFIKETHDFVSDDM